MTNPLRVPKERQFKDLPHPRLAAPFTGRVFQFALIRPLPTRTPFLRTFFFSILALTALGCQSQQTFNVTVTNRLSDPVTVWMTKAKPVKDGQYEDGWVPPEVVAIGTTGDQHLGGVAVEPGETAHTTLKGTIESDDVAVLRVYRSTDLNDMLTKHYGSPDRLDIPLSAGITDIDVVKRNGQMTSVPHGTSP